MVKEGIYEPDDFNIVLPAYISMLLLRACCIVSECLLNLPNLWLGDTFLDLPKAYIAETYSSEYVTFIRLARDP